MRLVLPLLLLMILGLGGCASRGQAVETVNAENVIAAVNRGDEVRIAAHNGFEYRFVVTKITNKALYGDTQRVLYSEMRSVSVKKGRSAAPADEAAGEGAGSRIQEFFSRIF